MQNSRYRLGLNFSHREAARLGLEPDEALATVLIHLKPADLRLSLYWDEIATGAGVYDFSAVQQLLDRVQKQGIRVLLTVGLKPQRHPALAIPAWLAGSSKGSGEALQEQGRLAANLVMILERTIALLADYDAIDAWEVEHLPFLPRASQPPGWSVGRALLEREIGVVREVDPRHRPVVVSHRGGRLLERGWRDALVAADVLGCTVTYPPGPLPLEGRGRLRDAIAHGLVERARWWQLSLQATLAARFGRPLWITELDAPSARLGEAIESSFAAGAARVYLAGAEDWLLMRSRGQPEPWNEARALLRFAAERLP